MSQHEEDLQKEIVTLRKKLETSTKWMQRQVQESTYAILINRFKKFRFFGRRYTAFEIWKKRGEAFLVGAGIIMFWRGIWNLADHYLFPDHSNISAFASLFIGAGLMILTRSFVNQFLDEAIEKAD